MTHPTTTQKELKIQGMVCKRCIIVLKDALEAIGVEVIDIQLGRILIRHDPNVASLSQIENSIEKYEFGIIREKEAGLSEQIKSWVIYYVWHSNHSTNLSQFLVQKLNRSYEALSRIFTKVNGKSIERFSIQVKMERAKELLDLGQLNSSEIAYELGYQHPSALTRQFKKENGMTLRDYQKHGENNRLSLDKI